VHFDEEESKEVENMDVNHIISTCEVMDNANEKVSAYHEPMKTKKVNIGSKVEPKDAAIGDY
ncbi:hypothetical protein KI387_029813, partial [Taxus chinensis]